MSRTQSQVVHSNFEEENNDELFKIDEASKIRVTKYTTYKEIYTIDLPLVLFSEPYKISSSKGVTLASEIKVSSDKLRKFKMTCIEIPSCYSFHLLLLLILKELFLVSAQSSSESQEVTEGFPIPPSIVLTVNNTAPSVALMVNNTGPSVVPISNNTDISKIPTMNSTDGSFFNHSNGPSSVPSSEVSLGEPSSAPSSEVSTGFLMLPTNFPSMLQSDFPSFNPSSYPSPAPSSHPTTSQEPSKAKGPTVLPSYVPSPFPTNPPSYFPSNFPSFTVGPSVFPSLTVIPSIEPSESPKPTPVPSTAPTATAVPSPLPSIVPTGFPTATASSEPSSVPSFSAMFMTEILLNQEFTFADSAEFEKWNTTEISDFESIMEGYTLNITQSADDISKIITICEVKSQEPFIEFGSENRINRVEYIVSWSSSFINITNFSDTFPVFLAKNLNELDEDLQEIGLNMTGNFPRVNKLSPEPSAAPSASLYPSENPSIEPSLFPSEVPSATNYPSNFPSLIPSIRASDFPSNSLYPSFSPTSIIISVEPSTIPISDGINTTAVVSVILTLGALVLIGLFFFYRRREKQKEKAYQVEALNNAKRYNQSPSGKPFNFIIDTNHARHPDSLITPRSDDNAVAGMISPSDSLLSKDSLLSPGDSIGGVSLEDIDGTHVLADEFDEYKDKNLEKMRADVEENLTGFDGMMSQAMTKALMADEDPVADQSELFWGGSGDTSEIEASALCEVSDWLKRKEGANLEERRGFMQDTMNKMVASVRHGMMQPDEAARTIHECAAILGLELATEIAENTVIVTGLRKGVTKSDLKLAFDEFGEIEVAAVASKARGFGMVRFISPSSARKTISKFRHGEIVVQDVAVTVKILKSERTMMYGGGVTTAES